MKTRSDFVSNSSSSSFILAGNACSFVAKFGLTKQDFVDAILDLSGGKDEYAKYVAEHNIKSQDQSWFQVYDKALSSDKKVMNSKKVDYLKNWNNYILKYSHKDKNYIRDNGWSLSEFEEVYSMLRNVFKLPWTYDIHAKTNWTYSYDPKTKKEKMKKVPEHLDKVIRDLYKHYGVLTNHDVLMCDFSRFLFHFDDNDIYRLNGMIVASKNDKIYDNPKTDLEKLHNDEVRDSIYESESYSIQRVCEIFFNWFKDNGKLAGLKNETWEDLYDDIVAVTMHEG